MPWVIIYTSLFTQIILLLYLSTIILAIKVIIAVHLQLISSRIRLTNKWLTPAATVTVKSPLKPSPKLRPLRCKELQIKGQRVPFFGPRWLGQLCYKIALGCWQWIIHRSRKTPQPLCIVHSSPKLSIYPQITPLSRVITVLQMKIAISPEG